MKWVEIKVIFVFLNNEMAADLISNIFFEMGIHGVVIQDPDEKPAEGWGDSTDIKAEYNAVTGYSPVDELTEQRKEVITDRLNTLQSNMGIEYRIEFQEIDEDDWAESWKKYFWPQKISKQIVIKPTWREYEQKSGEIVIEIDPGMAFGTGAHPTTSLCVEMLEEHLKIDDSVLDVGTGSGILLLAASSLGNGNLFGIDIDRIAVKIAKQNLTINNVETSRFQITTGDINTVTMDGFNIIIANILTDVILEIIDDVKKRLKDNGIFICSGIIEEKKDIIINRLKSTGFEIIDLFIKEKWVAICAKRI